MALPSHAFARAGIGVLFCAMCGGTVGQGEMMARSIAVRVEAQEAKVTARYRPTRCIRFVNCEYHWSLLGGAGEWRIRDDAVETREFTAKRDGRELYFEKTSHRPLGPSGMELERIDVALSDATFSIRWSRTPGLLGVDKFYFDDVLYLNYHRGRGSYENSTELAMQQRPREIRIRPQRLKLEPTELLEAVDRRLREHDNSWAGWREVRPATGPGFYQHGPSGATLSGTMDGPGTLRLRAGRKVRVPVAPVPRGGNSAEEETLEAIVIPWDLWEAMRIIDHRTGGVGRDGAPGEAHFTIPPEVWKKFLAAEAKDAGLAMDSAQGEDRGPTAPGKEPAVCLALTASTGLPERVLVVSVHHPDDTAFWLVAYRLQVVP